MGIAKIEHLEWNSANGVGFVIDRRHHTGCDIINPGIVTSGRTVAENGHGLACLNQRSELVYGQIWALPGPVNREETEANHGKCKKMRIGVAKHFPGDLGGSVHGDWAEFDLVLGKGNPTRSAIYRTGRTEKKLAHRELAAHLKQIESAGHIDLLVRVRLLNRGTHTSARSQVNHHVRARALQGLAQANNVTNVDFRELITAHAADVFQVGLLPGRRIAFVQVIENPQLYTAAEKGLRDMRANEAGSTRQHNPLRPSAHLRF